MMPARRLRVRRAHGAVPKQLHKGRPVVGNQRVVALSWATGPKCPICLCKNLWLGAEWENAR